MGSKHAGVHLRCDDNDDVLAALKKAFNKKSRPREKDLAALEILKYFANQNIAAIEDPAAKAEKEAELSRFCKQALNDMETSGSAVIVVRKRFVSVYWYDHIRIENLRQETLNYSHMCGVPALGVGIFDDTNFSICAVRNAGEPDAYGCSGEYMFDYNDISPVKAEDICATIDAPFLFDSLQRALSCNDGESMAAAFEAGTGLPVLMEPEDCARLGMKQICRWGSAVVYSE